MGLSGAHQCKSMDYLAVFLTNKKNIDLPNLINLLNRQIIPQKVLQIFLSKSTIKLMTGHAENAEPSEL